MNKFGITITAASMLLASNVASADEEKSSNIFSNVLSDVGLVFSKLTDNARSAVHDVVNGPPLLTDEECIDQVGKAERDAKNHFKLKQSRKLRPLLENMNVLIEDLEYGEMMKTNVDFFNLHAGRGYNFNNYKNNSIDEKARLISRLHDLRRIHTNEEQNLKLVTLSELYQQYKEISSDEFEFKTDYEEEQEDLAECLIKND